MSDFFNNINMLNKSLDGLWLRNKTINQNLSNATTPNYKKLTVNFEDSLKEALDHNNTYLITTHEAHIPLTKSIEEVEPNIDVDSNYSYRFDGNNVDIDVESANLAKNQIMYNAVSTQISGEFDKIKNVINEGGR